MSSLFQLTIVDFNQLSSEAKSAVDQLAQKYSGKKISDQSHCVKYTLDLKNPEEVRKEIQPIAGKFSFDSALVQNDLLKAPKILFIFDMDSTLINGEVINELAHLHGVGDQVREITVRAMNGDLNFDQSLSERVKMLKGLTRKQMHDLDKRLLLNPGVEEFVKRAKALGHKTAIASGGFKFFAEDLQIRLGMDYSYSNDLEFDQDLLTGSVIGEIINAEAKAVLVDVLAERENLTPAQVVAVGDGANDLLMLAKAGMGVAFHAKEKVRREANFHINYGPMTSLLHYLNLEEK